MMLWSLAGVPLVAGSLLLVCGRRADPSAAPVAVAATVLTLVLSVVVAVQRPAVSASYVEGISFGLRVDGLSAVMVVTVSVVLLAVLVFAAGSSAATRRGRGSSGSCCSSPARCW
ncbi:hypothetical protein ACFSVJ_28105 [Prauserella oleivorans]